MDEVEQSSLNRMFFSSMILIDCGLSCHGEAQCFSYWWEDFQAYVLSIWLQFNNTKWIIPRWSYYTHNINFLLWSSVFGVVCQSIAFCNVEHWRKRLIFVTCNKMSQWIFSQRVWGTETPSLLMSPIFFRWWPIMDWDVLRSSANSRVLLHGLHSTNSL